MFLKVFRDLLGLKLIKTILDFDSFSTKAKLQIFKPTIA
jgi:hypothetical protein